jgi:Caspase domain
MRLAVVVVTIGGGAVALFGPAFSQDKGPRKLALLVGCTRYVHDERMNLEGPVNDVKLFGGLLARHGFAEAGITALSGWPDDPARRPTRANIVAGFDWLIKQADDQAQVVILLSGHGSQIPIPEGQDPLDPKNFEPDGLDEIFLAADLHRDKNGDLTNYILDDEIGVWLDRLRDKGSNVWIIFDCCHSGTMDRGPAAEDEIRYREVPPEQLGVPKAKLDATAQLAAAAVEKAKKTGRLTFGDLLGASMADLGSGKGKKKGSVVATYAAQSYERAPERVRPTGAARAPEHVYGVLTYAINAVLSKQQGALTFRELERAVVGNYFSEFGASSPTPFFEGDLDRKVLGNETWPKRSLIVLKKDGKKLEVNAGELLGLTTGSVLAVHPAGGDSRDPKTVLGYARAGAVTPTSARVVPCAFAKLPVTPAEDLPAGGSCEVVARDFGDMKLRLAVGKLEDAKQTALLADVAGRLDKETLEMVRLVDQPEADWVLWIKAGELQLRQGEGRPLGKEVPPTAAKLGLPAAGKVFAVCSAALPAKDIAPRLQGDLQRIFTWHNVWRIAGAIGNGQGGEDLGLTLQVVKVAEDGQEQGPLSNGGALVAGQELKLRFRNEGVHNLRVTVLFLGGDGEIAPKAFDLKSGGKAVEINGAVNDRSSGKEGFVVLASALGGGKPAADYSFLAQSPLATGTRSAPDLTRGPETPFGSLLQRAVVGKGERSWDYQAPTNPMMLTASWVTVTPPNKGK